MVGQFLLLGLLVGLPWLVDGQSSPPVRIVGYLMVVAGVGLAAVAAFRLDEALTPWPEPRPMGELRTDSIYGVVRHPIYSGVLLIGYGLAVRAVSFWAVAAALALTLLLMVKASYEERLLREKFDHYAAYCERVPRFVPRWRPARR